jgi:hypothetical protein
MAVNLREICRLCLEEIKTPSTTLKEGSSLLTKIRRFLPAVKVSVLKIHKLWLVDIHDDKSVKWLNGQCSRATMNIEIFLISTMYSAKCPSNLEPNETLESSVQTENVWGSISLAPICCIWLQG